MFALCCSWAKVRWKTLVLSFECSVVLWLAAMHCSWLGEIPEILGGITFSPAEILKISGAGCGLC